MAVKNVVPMQYVGEGDRDASRVRYDGCRRGDSLSTASGALPTFSTGKVDPNFQRPCTVRWAVVLAPPQR
jgi:hypothetical protein